MTGRGHRSFAFFCGALALSTETLPFINKLVGDSWATPYLLKMNESIAQSRGVGEISEVAIFFFMFLVMSASAIPDLDLKYKENGYRYHRQATHSVLIWFTIGALAFLTSNFYLYGFFVGGLTHLIGDAITGDIPWLLWGKRRSYTLEEKNVANFKPTWMVTRIGIQQLLWFLPKEPYQKVQNGVVKLTDALSLPFYFFGVVVIVLFYKGML